MSRTVITRNSARAMGQTEDSGQGFRPERLGMEKNVARRCSGTDSKRQAEPSLLMGVPEQGQGKGM